MEMDLANLPRRRGLPLGSGGGRLGVASLGRGTGAAPSRDMAHFRELGTLSIDAIGERRVRAYVPTRRDDDGPPPVLILFDGQNVFGDEGSFSGGWHVHEAVQARADAGLPSPVVVAIDHGNALRVDELGPYPCDHGGGRLRYLMRAIATQLVPRVTAELGAASGPENTVLGGSSMGGLAALFGHLTRPDVFGGALAMSPALWFADHCLLRTAEEVVLAPDARVYLDAGWREGSTAMLEDVRSLAARLRERGLRDLRVVEDVHGGHCEAAWRSRFPAALDLLFPARAAMTELPQASAAE